MYHLSSIKQEKVNKMNGNYYEFATLHYFKFHVSGSSGKIMISLKISNILE